MNTNLLNNRTKFGAKNFQALPSNHILHVGSFFLAAPCSNSSYITCARSIWITLQMPHSLQVLQMVLCNLLIIHPNHSHTICILLTRNILEWANLKYTPDSLFPHLFLDDLLQKYGYLKCSKVKGQSTIYILIHSFIHSYSFNKHVDRTQHITSLRKS